MLLTANPLEDIANTTKIDSVWLRGKHYDRAALDGLLKGVSDAVAAAAPAEANITLDLPGEVILRGTYKLKFGPFDAGVEDVLITKTADGYSMMAHNRPQGGPQAPFVVTWHAGPDFAFRSAQYRQLTKSPTEAAYTLEGGSFKGTATHGGKPLEPASVEVGPDDALSSPAFASDFFGLGRLNLQPGGAAEMRSVSFGFPDWRPVAAPLKVVRQEDADLVRPGGQVVKARLYKQVLATDMGAFNAETWTDERGVVLKSTMTMPFGTMTVELQP